MADSLGAKLKTVIDNLPQDGVRLAEIRNVFGRDGLMLLAVFLTIPFMLPISIPGVSTVFGAAILLIGISRLFGRNLWLPKKSSIEQYRPISSALVSARDSYLFIASNDWPALAV